MNCAAKGPFTLVGASNADFWVFLEMQRLLIISIEGNAVNYLLMVCLHFSNSEHC